MSHVLPAFIQAQRANMQRGGAPVQPLFLVAAVGEYAAKLGPVGVTADRLAVR